MSLLSLSSPREPILRGTLEPPSESDSETNLKCKCNTTFAELSDLSTRTKLFTPELNTFEFLENSGKSSYRVLAAKLYVERKFIGRLITIGVPSSSAAIRTNDSTFLFTNIDPSSKFDLTKLFPESNTVLIKSSHDSIFSTLLVFRGSDL